MGADWLQLFDKRLCDEIVSLSSQTLAAFVEAHLGQFGEFSRFRHQFDGMPVQERIRQLLEGGDTEAGLREELVDELCFTGAMIHLDYWGCYVEVFGGTDPAGAISDYLLFPQRQEQSFLLLLPDHVDRILESLTLHSTELTIMTESDIDLVRECRDICQTDVSRMVAYVFDV